MSKIKWTSLALLALVILDATGDAFRALGWQILHHIMESLQIAGWVAVWALFEFNLVFVVMYILGRFVGFDAVFNLIKGNPFFYVGDSSIYGTVLSWFTGAVKTPPTLLVSMLKFMALIWWVAWFWTNRMFRELKI